MHTENGCSTCTAYVHRNMVQYLLRLLMSSLKELNPELVSRGAGQEPQCFPDNPESPSMWCSFRALDGSSLRVCIIVDLLLGVNSGSYSLYFINQAFLCSLQSHLPIAIDGSRTQDRGASMHGEKAKLTHQLIADHVYYVIGLVELL